MNAPLTCCVYVYYSLFPIIVAGKEDFAFPRHNWCSCMDYGVRAIAAHHAIDKGCWVSRREVPSFDSLNFWWFLFFLFWGLQVNLNEINANLQQLNRKVTLCLFLHCTLLVVNEIHLYFHYSYVLQYLISSSVNIFCAFSVLSWSTENKYCTWSKFEFIWWELGKDTVTWSLCWDEAA